MVTKFVAECNFDYKCAVMSLDIVSTMCVSLWRTVTISGGIPRVEGVRTSPFNERAHFYVINRLRLDKNRIFPRIFEGYSKTLVDKPKQTPYFEHHYKNSQGCAQERTEGVTGCSNTKRIRLPTKATHKLLDIGKVRTDN